MRFLEFPPEKVQQALASWQWLPVHDKQPLLVTAFGDIFLRDADGIYFLDTVQGSFELVCETEGELEFILATEEGADRYLLADLAAAAQAQGIALAPDQCLNFIVDPVVGGAFDISNIQALDFVAAVNAAGQIHEQVKDLEPGTPLTFVKLADDQNRP